MRKGYGKMRIGERVMVTSEADIAKVVEGIARRFREHGTLLVTVERMTGRSNNQNALLWSVVSQIADAAKVSKEDMHEHLLITRYGCRQAEFSDERIAVRPKSSKFSKAQMADYIEWVLAWAAERGIRIVMPDYWGGEY